MTIKPFDYSNPQNTQDVSSTKGQIAPFQYELAPQKKIPASVPVEFKPTSTLKETIKAIPSSVAENLPFGVGSIVKFANEDPTSVYNLTFEDVLQGMVDTSKGVYKGLIGAGVNLVPVGVKFNVPGLGEVTNAQFRTAERIRNGEDPTIVALEEGAGAIFDTLMLVGLVTEVAGVRPTTIAKTTMPEDITVKNPVKSFRMYNEPVATQTLSPDTFAKMVEKAGGDPNTIVYNAKYNPDLPTYFKMTGKANGQVTGEVVQIKPSYLDTFLNALKGDTSKVPDSQVTRVISKTVDTKQLSTIKPTTPVSPTITNGMKIAPAPLEVIPFDPNATVKSVQKSTAPIDVAEIKRVADNIQKNNTGLIRTEAEAMARDVILGREFNQSTKEPTQVKNELDINAELQAQAEEDWANNIADNYTELTDQVAELQKELKTVSTSEKISVQEKLDKINKELGTIEDNFIQKWTDTAKKTKTPAKEKPVKSTEKVSETKDDLSTPEGVVKNMIRGYVERGDDFKSLVKGQLGVGSSDYSASIGGYLNGKKIPSTSVAVTKVAGKDVSVVVPLKKIFDEIKAEKKAVVSNQILKNKTQKEKVSSVIKNEPKTIKEIANETKIKEPNVRRILGVGTKDGTFERVDKGVYKLTIDGQDIAYVETGSAVDVLPRLAKEGFKSDMVFLDIPYDTPAIKGGNRGMNYNLISVEEFGKILDSIKDIARTEDSPIIHMFSQAPSGMKAMQKYNDMFLEKGFVPVGKGELQKTFKDGKPVTNPRGEVSKPEGILVFTQSGNLKKDLQNLNFRLVRPKGYQSEKPAEMLKAMIEMTTEEGDTVLDPFAGSGVTGAEAVKLGRKSYSIEKNKTVSEEITKPRIESSSPKSIEDKALSKLGLKIGDGIKAVLKDGSTRIGIVNGFRKDYVNKAGQKAPNAVRADFTEAPLFGASVVPVEGSQIVKYDLTKKELSQVQKTKAKIQDGKDHMLGVGKYAEKKQSVSKEILKSQKQENKYYINQVGVKGKTGFVEVKGTPVEIAKGLDTFIYKSEDGTWVVTESRSGMRLETGDKTRKDAIEKAIEKVESYKKSGGNIQELINSQVEKYGLSPTYLAPKKATGSSSSFASMDKFREDIKPTEDKIQQDIKPIEFPELVRLAKQLTGDFPKVKLPRMRPSLGGRPNGLFVPSGDGSIILNPELFQPGNEQQLARTMAHELGHLIDYLPDKSMARGNILGRLAVLKKFRKDFFNDAGVTRTDSAMKKELMELTKYWRPYDPETAGASFVAYRKKPEELYADFISALFNDPKLLLDMTPESYNTFFKRLDEKPDVKVAYFELQKLLSGTREEVLKARSEDIRAGFEKAEALQKDFADKKELAKKSSWERLRQQLDDINYPILKKQKALEAKGQYLPEDQSPKYLLEEQSFADNENFLMMEKVDKSIDKPLADAGLTREDFGEFLFLNRVIGKENVPEESRAEDAVMGETEIGDGYTVTEMTSDELLNQPKKAPEPTDRQNLANPFGFQIKSAKEQLDFMRKSLGEEKMKVLEDSAQAFHDIVFKSVEEAVRTGAYNKELFDTKIKPNKDTYVTFAVVDYLQDKVPATVKAQYGTLKEIANPYISTILKTIALNRLNAYQRAKVATKTLLEQTGDITPSKKITDGKLTIYKVAPDKGEFTLLEDGKLRSYDVDPYIAESFKRDKVGDLNTIVWLLDTFNNKLFKPMVTTYNLGFAAAFNPIRDFKRNYKLIPNATVFKLLKAYASSLPESIKYTKGELDDFTRSLVESKAIDAPSNDYQFDLSDDSQYQRILERYGLVAKKDGGILSSNSKVANLTKILLKPVTKTLEGMRFIANTLEIISKVGGAKVRIAGGEQGKELAYNLRNYTGTPNFRRKGTQTRTTNAIFTFSNIMKEGMKTDFQFATNPNTRGGYWWKTVKIDLLPKFLMFLAGAGYLGKELKDMFDKMSEYDKSNYITIPLGETENGKVVYVRVPHDETGRLVSAVFWKMANFAKDHEAKDLQDIFAFGAGQLPQINAAIEIPLNWVQYLSGKNPYDSFRGRNIIDDTTFQAGGGASLKKMAEWTISDLGLTTFASYDTSKETTLETFIRITPWFNRVVRVSDYGLTEQLNKTVKGQKQEEAKQSLLKRDILKNYTAKIDKPEDITPILLVQLEKDIYGKDSNDKSKRTALKTSLLKNLIRNDSPEVNSLLTATSNAQKLATLKEIKKSMSTSEFADLKTKLVKYKVVSSDLIKTLDLQWKQ